MALTPERVTDLFMEYLPAGVDVVFENPDTYVASAMSNPFVQYQIKLGIYDETNIWTEFLGVAKSIVVLDQVIVCLQLINGQVEGLPGDLAEAYVRHVAAHEAHHFEHNHAITTGNNLIAQAHRENECNQLIAERYPQLEQLRSQVDKQSVIISRVYKRIRDLQRRDA